MNHLINKSTTKSMMLKFSEELLNNQKHLNYLKYQPVNWFHFTIVNLNQPNYYDVLKVSKDADQKTIKKSYLELCKLFHPDTKESNLTEEDKIKKFQKINEAYSCLSKPESKQAYDQSIFEQRNPYYAYPYQNMYRYRVRKYPKRPDGYRPYDENSYKESFKNKSSYSYDPYDPYASFRNRSSFDQSFDDDFRRFREEFHRAGAGPRASKQEIRFIKAAFYSFLVITLYVFIVRIYVLKTHLKHRKNRTILDEERFRGTYEDDYFDMQDDESNAGNRVKRSIYEERIK